MVKMLLKKVFGGESGGIELYLTKPETDEYENFVKEHQKSCGIDSVWISFKIEDLTVYKKFQCPMCKKERVVDSFK